MGTVVVIVLTIVTALAISWVTWLVTQHLIAQDRKRLLDERKPSIPITFDDRLRELRDTFQSVYDLLYPNPMTRPVAGVGWCPYLLGEIRTDRDQDSWPTRHLTLEGIETNARLDVLFAEQRTELVALDAQLSERAGLPPHRDGPSVDERFAALLQKDATAIRERNASRE